MNFLKLLGERLLLFIIGIVILGIGVIIWKIEGNRYTVYEFKWYGNPFVYFILGIACIVLTFSRKNFFDSTKDEKQLSEKKEEGSAPFNNEKIPPPLNEEIKPPPLP